MVSTDMLTTGSRRCRWGVLNRAITFAEEATPFVAGRRMSRPRGFGGGMAVDTGEIHHGGGHRHDPYAVAFGGAQQLTKSSVGTTAAKPDQYALGHIKVAPLAQ